MKYHDLCWKGVHASDLGVIVTDQVCYKRPAIISNTVTVPGRSGTLTISQDTAYDVVPYSPGLAIRPGADLEAVYAWLQGSGRVIFGSMPDDAFGAVITDQVDVTEHSPGHPAGYRMLVPTFSCQPHRYETIPAPPMTGSSTLSGFNPRNAAAAPLISVTAAPGTVLTIAMSGCAPVTIETPSSDNDTISISLDCDAMEVSADGILIGHAMLGDFPTIAPGPWTLSVSGEAGIVHTVTLTPRWRSI